MTQFFLLTLVIFFFQAMLFAKNDLAALSYVFAAEVGAKGKPVTELWFAQPWLAENVEGFRPGHIAIYPDEKGLVVIGSFDDEAIYSEATGMNQPMWQLGDVFEVFIAVPNEESYWELHITPHYCPVKGR